MCCYSVKICEPAFKFCLYFFLFSFLVSFVFAFFSVSFKLGVFLKHHCKTVLTNTVLHNARTSLERQYLMSCIRIVQWFVAVGIFYFTALLTDLLLLLSYVDFCLK